MNCFKCQTSNDMLMRLRPTNSYICEDCAKKDIYVVIYKDKAFDNGPETAFSRGFVDSYYGYGREPRKRLGRFSSEYKFIDEKDLTDDEVGCYLSGYNWNSNIVRSFKDYGY